MTEVIAQQKITSNETLATTESQEKKQQSSNREFDFDMLVLGSGPGGCRAALQAAKLGKKVAIIEKSSGPGGVMVHTGTLPSKTMRETAINVAALRQSSISALNFNAQFEFTVADLMRRKDVVIQAETEVLRDQLLRNGIKMIRGSGVLTSPNHIIVSVSSDDNRVISAGYIVVAVGTHPHHPQGVAIDHQYIYDGESILGLDEIPRSLTVVGAGVIGCEYACIFAALGVKVTLMDIQDRLLGFVDHEISDTLVYLLRKRRIRLILGDGAKEIFMRDGRVVTITENGRQIISDRMLYSAGRGGNTENIGLEAVGIETNKRGLIEVDEHYKTSCDSVYAVGDVIGFPSLASASMDQGRLASFHAFRREEAEKRGALNELLPYGIYTIPEMSLVGHTEESAREAGEEFEVGISRFAELARGQIMNDHDGMLKIVFRRSDHKLLGVHVIGERAAELVHLGQAVMSFDGTIDYFIDTVFNYPTLSEAYKIAALDGIARLG
ncbi:Si-specific NAD(P)(+) transhydrogenase [Gemmatimonas aurantiaca]|nr:Si-specific NAD(P)(+) transhydrogenase [Gemmatimonas aurantiaca]